MKAVGSQATPEVVQTWREVYQLFQKLRGERRERLQQVAEQLGVTYKIARRRLRNYEAMHGLATNLPPARRPAIAQGERSKEMSAQAGMEDRQLTCVDCGEGYIWSAEEQEF